MRRLPPVLKLTTPFFNCTHPLLACSTTNTRAAYFGTRVDWTAIRRRTLPSMKASTNGSSLRKFSNTTRLNRIVLDASKCMQTCRNTIYNMKTPVDFSTGYSLALVWWLAEEVETWIEEGVALRALSLRALF